MAWDGNKANDYFISLYEKQYPDRYKYKPKNPPYTGLHDIELALQKLYSECASCSFKKESLISTLDYYLKNPPTDNRAYDELEYQEIFLKEAKKIGDQIETGELPFS